MSRRKRRKPRRKAKGTPGAFGKPGARRWRVKPSDPWETVQRRLQRAEAGLLPRALASVGRQALALSVLLLGLVLAPVSVVLLGADTEGSAVLLAVCLVSLLCLSLGVVGYQHLTPALLRALEAAAERAEAEQARRSARRRGAKRASAPRVEAASSPEETSPPAPPPERLPAATVSGSETTAAIPSALVSKTDG